MPEIKACNPEDFYTALIYSSAAISIYTTAFGNYFGKPIIFVNRFENYAFHMLNRVIQADNIYDKNLTIKNMSFIINF